MGRRNARDRLNVLLNGQRVGVLTRSPPGVLGFEYAATWLERRSATPISIIRRRIAEKLGAGGAGTFDLLSLIGRDCVGALQLLPEDEAVKSRPKLSGVELHDKEIAAILRNLTSSPLGIDPEKGFRISIAGAQEKTALLWWNGKWHRPEGPTPTTHILKPSVGLLPNGLDMTESVENEALCLRLAEHFGLAVNSAEIAEFDGVKCLSVERFDRRRTDNGKGLLRLPQEDLCQALGIPSTRKYESDGGPGIARILDFLDSSDDRDRDREVFLRAQMVFFLLGAIDGHAKNFSVFLTPTGFRLTPLYDILSIEPALVRRQIALRDARLVMCVGNGRHYRLKEIHRRHWDETAKASRFPREALGALIDDILERVRLLDAVGASLPRSIPEFLADQVMRGIRRRARAMAKVREP